MLDDIRLRVERLQGGPVAEIPPALHASRGAVLNSTVRPVTWVAKLATGLGRLDHVVTTGVRYMITAPGNKATMLERAP